jgi:hypothetical protein
MRFEDQNVANRGSTYMAPFWKENQLVWTLFLINLKNKKLIKII